MKISSRVQALVLTLLIVAASGGTASAERVAGLSGQTLKVVLNEWTTGFTQVTASSGKLTLQIVNAGRYPHNFAIRKKGGGAVLYLSPMLRGGKTAAASLDLPPGSYEVYCAVAGHRARGMLAALTIGG